MSDMQTTGEDALRTHRAAALKPCPFCGNAALALQSLTVDYYGWWMARCDAPDNVCPVEPYVVIGPDDEDREKAIAAWNRRAEPPPTNPPHSPGEV